MYMRECLAMLGYAWLCLAMLGCAWSTHSTLPLSAARTVVRIFRRGLHIQLSVSGGDRGGWLVGGRCRSSCF